MNKMFNRRKQMWRPQQQAVNQFKGQEALNSIARWEHVDFAHDKRGSSGGSQGDDEPL